MADLPLEQRRRVARLLRDLIRDIVTADVDDGDLAPIAAALEPLRARLAAAPKLQRKVVGLHTPDYARARTGREPLYDRDPLIGLSNPLSPPLRRIEGGDIVEWEVTFGDAYEGHPGFVHGGYVASVIDHVLGVTAASSGLAAMTGTLTIRYRRPTPLNTLLACRGRVSRIEGRKVFCEAAVLANDEIVVEGEGIYLHVDPDRY